MEAYSLDLRLRVLAACDAGQPTKKVSEQFDVSPAWVRRMKQRRREDGSIEPRPIPGGRPKLDEAARQWVLEQVRRQPDMTLEELRGLLKKERAITISIGALWNTLRKLKFSFKKVDPRRRAATRGRPGTTRGWHEQLKDVPLENLVVIDESCAVTNMTRRYGRCLRSERLVSAVPHGHWKVLTVIAAMTVRGVRCAVTIDAPCDGEIFRQFIRDVLAPTLRPGQVVIMDNLPSHKVSGIRDAIEKAGARLLYLPPYSPDLSPIEPMWSKVKQKLRSLAARTVETLGAAVQEAITTITASDCGGYFRHTGYTLYDK